MWKLDWTDRATKNITRVVGAAAFIFGAIFGSLEYEKSVEQDKLARSFEYFQSYSTNNVAQSRRVVWNAIESAYEAAGREQEPPDGRRLDDFLVSKLDTWPKDVSLDIVIEHFDSVYKCVAVGGCNECTVRKLFHDRARGLYKFLKSVIQERVDEGNKTYGVGLENLAKEEVPSHC